MAKTILRLVLSDDLYCCMTCCDMLCVLRILICMCCMCQDAFSLLAYSDPASSPVSYQLNPIQREPVCTALNSAILGQ